MILEKKVTKEYITGSTPTPISQKSALSSSFAYFLSKNNYKQSNTRMRLVSGFTLIELLVATSIFLMTITVGITSLLMMHRTHNITQYKKEQFDALHAVMEDMVRNIRVGTKIRCDINQQYDTSSYTGFISPTDISTPQSCVSVSDAPANNSIAFEGIDGVYKDVSGSIYNTDQISYYIDFDSAINKWAVFKSQDINFMYNANGLAVRVTPDSVDIDINKSGFTVIHAEDSDLKQPLVLIRLVGTVTYQNDSTPFSIQTAVMQRNPKV